MEGGSFAVLSSLPVCWHFFCSPVLIQLLGFSGTACLQGASLGWAVWLPGCGCSKGLLMLWGAGRNLEAKGGTTPNPGKYRPCCKPPQPHSLEEHPVKEQLRAVPPGFAQAAAHAGHGLPLK